MATIRATTWSLTINNPTAADEEQMNLARQKGWKIEGQLEKGENGTQHYQLMLRTPQVRFSAVKKLFPRAHIEVARNPAALERYVGKEETRVGALPTSQDKYPSLSKFWHLIFDHYNTEDKDGLDYFSLEDGECRWYADKDDERCANNPLSVLDVAVGKLIRDGYYVENIAYNPSVRAQWKGQWRNLMVRCFKEKQNVGIEAQQQDGVLCECWQLPSGEESCNQDSASVEEASRGEEAKQEDNPSG